MKKFLFFAVLIGVLSLALSSFDLTEPNYLPPTNMQISEAYAKELCAQH